jgi:hypothetical protein
MSPMGQIARRWHRSGQSTLASGVFGVVALQRPRCVSMLNSFPDHPARLLVRSDQNGLVVIKVQHDIRSNECCRIIQLSDPKSGQQAA